MRIEFVKTEEDRKLLEIAAKVYFKFRNSDDWDEEYKYRILNELNGQLSPDQVTSDNVLEIVELLKRSNPQAGAFVYWANLGNLLDYTKARPAEVAEQITLLFNENLPLAIRINRFRDKASEFQSDIRLGTPLFGYLMAAFDYKKYPIYKDSIFQEFSKWFENLNTPSDIGEKYQLYVDTCTSLRDYLSEFSGKSLNLLDSQDFIYSLTEYDEAIFQVFTNYLNYTASELSKYERDISLFIEKLKTTDTEQLEGVMSRYKGAEKINAIRYEYMSEFLSSDRKPDIDRLHELQEEINSRYDTDIMRSWNDYKILFPFYYEIQKDRVRYFLNHIHDTLRGSTEEKYGLKLHARNKIEDFYGTQNFPTTSCWLALFPASKKNQQEAAQLGLSINPDGFVFGLHIGDKVKVKENYSNNEDFINPEKADLTLQMVINKHDEVIHKFKEVNGLNSQIDVDLAPPFSEIFEDYEQANWAFDLMAKALQELGVDKSNLNDPRFSVTLNKTQDRIRVDYGCWLLLGFRKYRQEDRWIEIALNTNQIDYPAFEFGQFNAVEDGGDYRLFLISKSLYEDNDQIRTAFFNTLTYARERMEHWKSSNLRKYHREQLANAIFDKEYRDQILRKGITEAAQAENDEHLYEEEIIELTWKDIKNSISYSFDQPLDLSKSKLHFPKEMRQNLENRVSTAIRNGKHVLLIGPPGTGKSKLAKAICEFYTGSGMNYQMSTATSDWSTFETIGGYRPLEDGKLEFRSGIFLKSFRHEVTRNPINRWLIIDEINRADIDKAFGALFSALTGDSIKLPYEHQNCSIEVIGRIEGDDTIIEDHHFVIHPDWRIVATMNTYDKTSLYEMSYAFMRRLAFIPVEIPKTIDAELIRGYIEIWNGGEVDDEIVEHLKVIWETINKTRKIGPAIVEDIFKYVKDSEEPDFTSAVIMFVMPQFEGLMDDKIISFVKDLTSKGYDKHGHLKEFCADFFRIEEAKFDSDKK